MFLKPTLFALILSIFILGCSSERQALHVSIKTPEIKNDYMPDSGYFYVLLEKEKEVWKIIQIEDKPTLKRKNKNQELLLVSSSYSHVYPYFDETLVADKNNQYLCDDSSKIKNYTPCSSALSLDSKSKNFSDYFNESGDTKKHKHVSKTLLNQAISDTNLYEAIESKKKSLKFAKCEDSFYKAQSIEDFNEFIKNYANYAEAKNLLTLALQNLQNLKDLEQKRLKEIALQKELQEKELKREKELERANLFLVKKEQNSIDSYAKKLANFRKTLQVGTQTNCGTIAELDSKGATIMLQDKNDTIWIQRDKIFPKGDGCHIIKGRYIAPPSF